MSRINKRRKNKARNDAEQRKHRAKVESHRHKKNPKLGARPLTGSVHAADYPPEGWNSRIRQRENRETQKMVADL